ncbi:MULTISPECIES: L-histidine N(alpha)-methyltransferase [unclassified Coleofasciculus]|uniref:L-histidine N(alpha)-methyltransferase n=1 Tax=unclassified Coleofasciculus TaxID=2692782 RepID=UPI001880D92D|nr:MULTISPECIES: L-histidine N(alpha)-methyltransferase [unclassified Coleofasciculus]MBE9127409.1 L-histidine N(alpha)-methyltransferase [Coleofasciculus sp. LEGE 07081]MBE9147165.1 L-histidine N(alpha)-methyltransferase [Coleofasciculus sp. LEGE 07092]
MNNLECYDFQPELGSFHDEILQSLAQSKKAIAPKFFYDKRGSELFERICELEEYYPTRTEIALLKTHSQEIAQLIGKGSLLIEYGSGSSTKVRILLEALQEPVGYMPIDISQEHMVQASAELAQSYSELDVIAVCADYTQDFQLPPYSKKPVNKKLIFFPGSTIGNLDPTQALHLLKQSASLLDTGDGMLIGVDLKKDPAILNAAYNDALGVTAEFNLNLLERINKELNANFDLANFRHWAFYNEEYSRIEMHLISLKEQTVAIAQIPFHFHEGETIHTESSYKYSIEEFQELADRAGFDAPQVWTDANHLFSLHYLMVR